jgi:hypothetical protein
MTTWKGDDYSGPTGWLIVAGIALLGLSGCGLGFAAGFAGLMW